jgi:3D (Asp-Asp-Asp) domain-containing protein
MINAKVTFKYGKSGNTATTTTGIPVDAKTESAVMAALKKRYPTYTNIVILKIA